MPADESLDVIDNVHMTPKQRGGFGSRRESQSPTRNYLTEDGRNKSTERGGGRKTPFDSMRAQAGPDLSSVKAMIRPKPY